MIQLDQNALRDCIREAIREELNLINGNIKKEVPIKEQTVPEKLSTKKQMSDELDVSLVTLTDWMKKGKIPYMRIGKRVYFKMQEVIDSMANFHHKKGGKQ